MVYQQFCQRMIIFALQTQHIIIFEAGGGGHVGGTGIYVHRNPQIRKIEC